MRYLIILFLVHLTYMVHSQCSCVDCPIVINNNSTEVSTIQISGLTNPTLGSGGQGICGINIFLETDAINEIEIVLTTPSGQMILLVDRTTGIGINQNLIFDISFIPCGQTAIPDAGYPAVFESTAYNAANNLTFTGSYYPDDGQCLESLSGMANGEYTLTLIDFIAGDAHTLQNWEIIFCDDTGENCNASPCEPGEVLSADVLNITECEGDQNLLLDYLSINWGTGGAPDPALYGITYTVTDLNNVVLERDDILDLTSYLPGTYTVCATSYLLTDEPLLPPESGGYPGDQIANDIANGLYCADIADVCTTVIIESDIPDPIVDWPDPPEICENVLYDFNITNFDPANEYVISIVSGAFNQFFFDDVNGIINIDAIAPFDLTLCVWIVDDCSNGQTCETFTVLSGATPPIFDGPVGLCNGENGVVTITNANVGDVFNWTISGPGIITANNNDNIEFLSTGVGIVEICATNTTGCASSEECIMIPISDPIPPSTNVLATYCLPGGFFNGNANGSSTSIMWEQISGPGTITFVNPTVVATQWTVDLPGVYIIRLTKENNACITFEEVMIEVLPSNPPPILDGPSSFCSNEIVNIFITNPDPNTTYVWSIIGPGIIVNNNGTDVDVEATGDGIVEVCVDATDNCGITSVCFVADVNVPEPPTANSNAIYCMPGGFFNGNENGGPSTTLYTQIAGPGIITFNDPNNVSTSWTADLPGIYELELLKTVNGCDTSELFTIEVVDVPVVSETVICSDGLFIIELTFSGGTAPYSVFGNQIVGNTYTSPPYQSGSAILTTYSDANSCMDEILIQEFCPCVSDAGTMDQNLIEICGENQSVVVNNNGDFILDANDIGVFILHDGIGNILGTIYDQNSTGDFIFTTGMSLGTTYYISYVVGTEVSNNIDLQDPCLSVSMGTPVVWYAIPEIILPLEATVCGDDPVFINATVNFGASIEWQYASTSPNTDGNLIVSDPFNPVFSAGSSGLHIIELIATENGCENNDSITITVNPPLVVDNIIEMCEGLTYSVMFDFVSGTPDFFVNGQLVVGNTYTSSSFNSGEFYSFEVIDGNGCVLPDIVGSKNCNCDSDAGIMPADLIEFCGLSEEVAVNVLGNPVLDNDDIGEYILHDNAGPMLGNVFEQNTSGIFNFVAPMVAGETYYISYVVGNENGAGGVDLSDVCLDIANGTPVVWYEPIDISFQDQFTSCSDTITIPMPDTLSNITTSVNILIGNNVISNIGATAIDLVFSSSGDYLIEVANNRGTCVDRDTISISIQDTTDLSFLTDTVLCGPSLDIPIEYNGKELQFTADNTDVLVTADGTNATFTTNGYTSTQVFVSILGSVCNDTTSFMASFIPDVNIESIEYECNTLGDSAMVTILIEGGTGEYIVNSDTFLQKEVNISGLDPSMPLAISVSSGNCPEVLDTVLIRCDCSTIAANLPDNLLEVCTEGTIISDFINTGQQGIDDTLIVFLHDGNATTIGTVLATNTEPTFNIDTQWPKGDTLWMTPYVGQLNFDGSIDLSDTCGLIGGSQPIIIIPTPESTFNLPTSICIGDTITGILQLQSYFYPVKAEVQIGTQSIEVDVENDQNVEIPIIVNDSIILINVSFVNTLCDIPDISGEVIAGDCSCEVYTFETIDNMCNDGNPLNLIDLEQNGFPATYSVSQGQATIVGDSLYIEDGYDGVIRIVAEPTLQEACDSMYMISFEVELVEAVGLSQSILNICNGYMEDIDLNDYLINTTNGSWQVDSDINPTNLPVGESTFTFTTMAGDYCPAESVDFIIQKYPKLDYIIETTNPACYDLLGQISLEIGNDSLLTQFVIDNVEYSNFDVQNLLPGLYSIALLDSNFCSYEQEVFITEPDPLILDIESEIEPNQNSSYILNANANGGTGDYNYKWLVGQDTIGDSGSSLTISIDEETKITLIVVDENGCTAEDFIILSILSQVKDDWVLPNVLRPGSQENGFIEIPATNDIAIVQNWSVFDRWGNKVFQAVNFDPALENLRWDGTFNGQDVAIGVYVSQIQYVDSQGALKSRYGDITIIK